MTETAHPEGRAAPLRVDPDCGFLAKGGRMRPVLSAVATSVNPLANHARTFGGVVACS